MKAADSKRTVAGLVLPTFLVEATSVSEHDAPIALAIEIGIDGTPSAVADETVRCPKAKPTS